MFRQLTDASTDLKAILAAKIPKEQEKIKSFRKQYGNTKVGDVTVEMVSAISNLYIPEWGKETIYDNIKFKFWFFIEFHNIS